MWKKFSIQQGTVRYIYLLYVLSYVEFLKCRNDLPHLKKKKRFFLLLAEKSVFLGFWSTIPCWIQMKFPNIVLFILNGYHQNSQSCKAVNPFLVIF